MNLRSLEFLVWHEVRYNKGIGIINGKEIIMKKLILSSLASVFLLFGANALAGSISTQEDGCTAGLNNNTNQLRSFRVGNDLNPGRTTGSSTGRDRTE